MAALDFFLTGSFKGVPFLFNQTSKTQGRKTITYEYINSKKRDVPDLGELKPTYNISATVTGVDEEYFSNRKRLENALSSFGSGFFVHPTDGTIKVQVSSYSVEESIRNVGEAVYNITFIATSDANFPVSSSNVASSIQTSFDSTLKAINEAFIAAYVVTTTYAGALIKYRNYYHNIINQFTEVLDLVPNDSSTISDLLNNIDDANGNISSVILSGINVTNTTASLYSNMLKLNSDKSQRSILNQSFFNFNVFGQDYNNTPSRVEAQINRRMMQQHINSYALINEFLNTSQTTYDTESDIEAQSKVLNSQYDFIMNNNYYLSETNSRRSLFDESVVDAITSLRDKTVKYLTQQLANAKKVQTVYVHNFSLIEIVTSIYSDVNLYDAIANLNEFANQAIIKGDIKVLVA